MTEITVYDNQGKMKKLTTDNDILIQGDKCYVKDDKGKLVEVPNPFEGNVSKKITFEA